MDTLANCEQDQEGQIVFSEFSQELQQLYYQAGQYCALDQTHSPEAETSLWQSLIDLIHSGYQNLSTNYELLLSGEIGAIYVVALIPLLLGIVLEVALVVGYRRKEKRYEKRQYQTTLMTQGRIAADSLINENNETVLYNGFKSILVILQISLVCFFLLAVPEYDRDVWCEEYKTQYSILKAGLETEQLQKHQQRANCEITKAVVLIEQSVDTLGDIFSKKNNTTVSALKKLVSNMRQSTTTLDSTKTSIDELQLQLKQSEKNIENVMSTLTMMESIASKLGVERSSGDGLENLASTDVRSLPETLADIEGVLVFQPKKQWYLNMLASKKDVQAIQQLEKRSVEALSKLNGEQEIIRNQLFELNRAMTSEELIDAIATKVAGKINIQPAFPLIMQPTSIIRPLESSGNDSR